MYHIGMKSAEQLLALINDTNNLSLTLEDVQFSTPLVLSPESQVGEENPSNTEVTVIAKPNRTPIGEVVVQYDRIDLAEFETIADPSGIVVTQPITHARLLEAFNLFYRSALELADIDLTSELPEEFTEETVLELKASSTSLAYRGGIILAAVPGDVELDSVILVKLLSGLQYMAPPP